MLAWHLSYDVLSTELTPSGTVHSIPVWLTGHVCLHLGL